MRPENKKMQSFLRANGFPNAVPKYLSTGSQKGCWRIYSKWSNLPELMGYERWTMDTARKFTALGFKDFDGRELSEFSGNGGIFQIFARYKGGE